MRKDFNEICREYKVTYKEKETAKYILEALNGFNKVDAINMLDFCKLVIDYNSTVTISFEE